MWQLSSGKDSLFRMLSLEIWSHVAGCEQVRAVRNNGSTFLRRSHQMLVGQLVRWDCG